jgi:threonyl-tRNA synthetase
MLVVGDREAESGQVAVRAHGRGDEGSASLDDVVEKLSSEALERGYTR